MNIIKKKIVCWLFAAFFCIISFIEAHQPFVMCEFMGQLGNQLFQIAATVSLALDNDARPIFPSLKNSNVDNVPLNYKHIFYHLDASEPDVPISRSYSEPFFHFTSIPYKPNMRLSGFFQSEKYFKHHKEAIIQLFQPSEEIKTYLMDKYADIIDHPKTVSVHIRMYKNVDPRSFPFIGWEYIHKAIASFDADSLFVVFSDEIEFCKNKLNKLADKRNLIFIEEKHLSHIYDLYLMSMCKHHIISNSSFSWWGAYLNQNLEKIVIAPSPLRWFGPAAAHLNTKDILPQEWKVLF